MQGTQTAVVVGPPGEAIFCDKYGRVKVQFPWDREGKHNVDSSCWVRVSNPWGGKGWGGNFLPHVGQEVVVDFEEGDPDRPIILGRVYNAECMPPLTLPGHKTKSIMRDQGGNQLIMEGGTGAQAIVLHSPCGKSTISLGAVAPSIPPIGSGFFGDLLPYSRTTGPAFSIFSEGDWNSNLLGNHMQHVKGWHDVEIDSYSNNYTHGPIKYFAGANWDNYIKGNYTCKVDGYQEYTTKGDYTTNVLGKNFVTIVGTSNIKMLAAELNVITGVRMTYDMSKDLRKTPLIQRSEGKLQQSVGSGMIKAGKYLEKVGDYRTKATKLREDVETLEALANGLMKFKAKTAKIKANTMEWVGAKFVAKGEKTFKGGETKINEALKILA